MKLKLIATALLIVVMSAGISAQASAHPRWGWRAGVWAPRPVVRFGLPVPVIAPPVIAPPVVVGAPGYWGGYYGRPYYGPRYAYGGYRGRGYGGYRGGCGRGHYRR